MRLWDGRRVVVCLGTGGVGKTTVAATMAVAAASEGLRTLVMTIDPARRLAQALGLGDQGNAPHPLAAPLLAEYGVQLRGSLHVMMPDVKSTFDALVRRWAPDSASAARILDNSIYQHFSTALAGSHEYAAVEQLYEVYTTGEYDLIILDTPPSQNAIAFLEAPGRILDFLDHETLQWLMKPTLLAGRMSARLLDWGGSMLFKALGRLAGAATLRDLTGFLLSFQGMYEGFGERSRKVKALLASEEVAFTLVTAPQSNQLRAMLRFRDQLMQAGLNVQSAVVNRTRQPPVPEPHTAALQTRAHALLAAMPPEQRQQMLQALDEERQLATQDSAMVLQLQRTTGLPVLALPELERDAHDLASLALLHRVLLTSAQKPRH